MAFEPKKYNQLYLCIQFASVHLRIRSLFSNVHTFFQNTMHKYFSLIQNVYDICIVVLRTQSNIYLNLTLITQTRSQPRVHSWTLYNYFTPQSWQIINHHCTSLGPTHMTIMIHSHPTTGKIDPSMLTIQQYTPPLTTIASHQQL